MAGSDNRSYVTDRQGFTGKTSARPRRGAIDVSRDDKDSASSLTAFQFGNASRSTNCVPSLRDLYTEVCNPSADSVISDVCFHGRRRHYRAAD